MQLLIKEYSENLPSLISFAAAAAVTDFAF